jgi:hypothetical protein
VVDKYGRFPTENVRAMRLEDLTRQEFCWAVEDSLPMARFLAGRMKLPVALIDRPLNRCESDPEGVSRYIDWQNMVATMSRRARSDGR